MHAAETPRAARAARAPLLLLALAATAAVAAAAVTQRADKDSVRCQETTSVAKKLEDDISICQEEIKVSILKELLEALEQEGGPEAAAAAREVEAVAAANGHQQLRRRTKREAFTGEDRRIAGCLLKCVYRRVGALDGRGYPLSEGLLSLYASGARDPAYRQATARAVQDCQLRAYQRSFAAAAAAYSTGSGRSDQTCELSYDIFECVSDRIEQYCLGG